MAGMAMLRKAHIIRMKARPPTTMNTSGVRACRAEFMSTLAAVSPVTA